MFKQDPKTIVSRNCLQTIFSRHFLKESRRKKDIFEPYLPTRISTAQQDHAEGVEDGVRPVVDAPADLLAREDLPADVEVELEHLYVVGDCWGNLCWH